MTTAPSCRLDCLLAGSARRGVILRRGPSRVVLLVGWDLRTDRFEQGSWMRGRVYERRCDLSPSGERLLYFAAKWATADRTWSAISEVPSFSAIARFPKGDAWGGGGLFESEHAIVLAHAPEQLAPTPGTKLPRGLSVRAMGRDDDVPLYDRRMAREGWRSIDGTSLTRIDPAIAEKPQPDGRLSLRRIEARRSGGSIVEHALRRGDVTVLELGRTEWADWDTNGDLLFADAGVLYRLPRAALARPRREAAVALLDLRGWRPEPGHRWTR